MSYFFSFQIVLSNRSFKSFFLTVLSNRSFKPFFQIHLGFSKIVSNIVYLFTGVVTLLCPFCEEVQSSAEELEKHSLARHGELNLDSEEGFENATQSSENVAEISGKTSPVYSEFLSNRLSFQIVCPFKSFVC